MDGSPALPSRVREFYNGKCVFITGASGFVGSVLLEILLRCIPEINIIYILLRKKNNVSPENRKQLLFKKSIFNSLLDKNPACVEKVHVIAGDVSQLNLGMRDEDLDELAGKVSVVFHAAAEVQFNKSLKYTTDQNCLGTKNIIDLCRKLHSLEALIYTSTYVSNVNQKTPIKEVIYRLPLRAEKYLETVKNISDKELEDFASACKAKDWNNVYAFSKCLSENIINDVAADLPVGIVRPGIVWCVYKTPYSGYLEEGFGAVSLLIALGRGYAQVLKADPEITLHLVPADVVANTLIVAAWGIATQRFFTPLVVNCSGHEFSIKLKDFIRYAIKLFRRNHLPEVFQKPDMIITKNAFLYWSMCLYKHYLPAFVIDMMFFKEKKLRLRRFYKHYDNVVQQVSFFNCISLDFEKENYSALDSQLDASDKEVFYLRLKENNVFEIYNSMCTSCTFYDWKRDKKGSQERKDIAMKTTMYLNILKKTFLILISLSVYVFVSFIF